MTMINLREAFEDRDVRGVFIICACALAVWGTVFAFAAAVSSLNRQVSDEISSSDEVLDYAMRYRALPRTGTKDAAAFEEPLGIVSETIDVLKLRDRTQRLQSSSSGVSIQLERMFGDELLDFLVSLENGGLDVRAAEIRALPASDIRLLSVSLTVEPAK
ncbi:MAG: hypothetical protein LBS35_03425 [Synergistaceae bacterium]|jgi:hypothetical protein|nr:hypothetical protein [Synergistaceae bacterium]